MVHRLTCFAALLSLLLLAVPASGQDFEPEGVLIDTEGVLKARRLDYGKELRELVKKAKEQDLQSELKAVPLVHTFREAKALIEADKPLPEAMKYLQGITRVRYLIIDEAARDLLLVGDAEPINTSVADRPVGAVTGRPVLQLDDLVAALRTAGPGSAARPFGCLIEQTEDSARRMVGVLKVMNAEAQSPATRHRVVEAMVGSAGPQRVRFNNVQPETRFALVMVEADYLLKRMVLGLQRSPVRGLPSFLHRQTQPTTLSTRFWFEVDYQPLLVSPDSDAYVIRGRSLQIRTQRRFRDTDKEDPTARQYAKELTEHFDELSRSILPFADLANLSDLSLVASLIRHDKIDRKIGWDTKWILDDAAGYPLPKVEVPETADALVNHHLAGDVVIFMGGGVQLDYARTLADREPADTDTVTRARSSLSTSKDVTPAP